MGELILHEEDGLFFANGVEISEESYLSLLDDFNDNEEDYEDECQFCSDVNFIIDLVENKDRDEAFEIIGDILNDYYEMGRADKLEEMINDCEDELEEMEEEYIS